MFARTFHLQVRRATTIRSHAEPAPEPDGVASLFASADWRKATEFLLIAGTGTFGAYEMYKGMFLLPQRAPTAEEIFARAERQRIREEEARLARLGAQAAAASEVWGNTSSVKIESNTTSRTPERSAIESAKETATSSSDDQGRSFLSFRRKSANMVDPYQVIEQVDKTE